MVSETTRNEVWQELLDASRLVRYYSKLSDRYSRNRRIVQFLLMAAATGGIATLVNLLPQFIQQIAAAAVAILVAWDFFADYAKKAAVLHAICIECNRLEGEWRQLWVDIDQSNLDDAGVRRQCASLRRRLNEVTARVGLVGVQEDAALNKQCAEDAYKVMQARYAT